MTLSRREFNRRALIGTSTLAVVGLAGCNVITDIEDWVPVGEEAVNSIIALLAANGIPLTPIITIAENDLNAALVALKDAAAEYNAITPPPATALQKVEAAITAVVDQFGAFVTALGLPDGSLINLIVALVKIAISTIVAFANKLMKSSGTQLAGVTLRYKSASGPFVLSGVIPKDRNKRQFKQSWNQVIDVDGSGLATPSNTRLHLTLRERLFDW